MDILKVGGNITLKILLMMVGIPFNTNMRMKLKRDSPKCLWTK